MPYDIDSDEEIIRQKKLSVMAAIKGGVSNFISGEPKQDTEQVTRERVLAFRELRKQLTDRINTDKGSDEPIVAIACSIEMARLNMECKRTYQNSYTVPEKHLIDAITHLACALSWATKLDATEHLANNSTVNTLLKELLLNADEILSAINTCYKNTREKKEFLTRIQSHISKGIGNPADMKSSLYEFLYKTNQGPALLKFLSLMTQALLTMNPPQEEKNAGLTLPKPSQDAPIQSRPLASSSHSGFFSRAAGAGVGAYIGWSLAPDLLGVLLYALIGYATVRTAENLSEFCEKQPHTPLPGKRS